MDLQITRPIPPLGHPAGESVIETWLGGGYSLIIISYKDNCVAPKSMAFKSLSPEIGYFLCTLVSLVSNFWEKLFLLCYYIYTLRSAI